MQEHLASRGHSSQTRAGHREQTTTSPATVETQPMLAAQRNLPAGAATINGGAAVQQLSPARPASGGPQAAVTDEVQLPSSPMPHADSPQQALSAEQPVREATGGTALGPAAGPYFECQACEWFGATLPDAVVVHFKVRVCGTLAYIAGTIRSHACPASSSLCSFTAHCRSCVGRQGVYRCWTCSATPE